MLCLCFVSCCAWRLDSKGSNLGSHTCKPHANLHTGTHVAHHARLVPLPMLAQMLHPMQDSCQPWARLVLARMLHSMQNPCQLWTWHECCNTSKTRATSNVGTDVAPLQYSCHFQCWHRCCYARSVPIVGQMLGRGRGLTCVDNCSSHSNTKKVKTRKKEP